MRMVLHLVLLALLMQAGSAMAQTAPFRFEDYREKTAFKNAVMENFPVGSSYLAFKRVVIPAGAKAARGMVDDKETDTHIFKKQQRATTGTNFIASWAIAVTVNNDIITAITPTLSINSSIAVGD